MSSDQMPLRRGVHLPLEEAANRLLKESLRTVTRHQDKSDVLTPWKEHERKRREIYVPSGTPDAALRLGIFHRSINPDRPDLNSREGVVRPSSRGGPMMPSSVEIPPTVSWDSE